MNNIQIKRKKYFCGCLASYQIILGYDIEKFKQLIQEIVDYYKSENNNFEKEEFFHKEIDGIKYLTIKNGEELNIALPKEIKTIFVCNNAMLNNKFYPTLFSCYPLVCSNQIEIKNDMALELTTKGGWKKIEFELRKIEKGSDING